MTRIPCPCCGFLTLEGEYGSYVLCDICDWEDDGAQLANPTSGGGANGKSLVEAQSLAIAAHPLGIELAKGFRRGRHWRPLAPMEIERANSRRAESHWHSKAVLAESEAYWWRHNE